MTTGDVGVDEDDKVRKSRTGCKVEWKSSGWRWRMGKYRKIKSVRIGVGLVVIGDVAGQEKPSAATNGSAVGRARAEICHPVWNGIF
jgi:hypothetical protein